MFGMNLEGKIGSITADVKDDDGTIVRRDTLALHFEFGSEFAAGINKSAALMQKMLASGELAAARMPLELALVVEVGEGKDGIKVRADWAKMTFKSANKEDACPQCKLELTFPTETKTHMFFVEHQRETWPVRITKEQLELGAGEGRGSGA